MATTLVVQATIQRASLIPADDVMNVWHFRSSGVDPVDDADAAVTMLQAFYEDIQGIYSTLISGAITYQVYDLLAASPRVPIYDSSSTIAEDPSGPLPAEVAICLSYHGLFTSGTNPARRRGRVFLGPLTVDVMENDGGDARPTDSARALIVSAASTMQGAGDPSGAQWAVFSPTTAGAPPWTTGELAGATLAVVAGHVDNAFDTMRSRGASPTLRNTWD